MPPTPSATEIFAELRRNKKKITINGVQYYIVEGDLRLDESQLLVYASYLAARAKARAEAGAGAGAEQREPLVGITDDSGRMVRWRKGLVLTYTVVKSTFETEDHYQKVVNAMRLATADWEAACGINFQHLSQLDAGPVPAVGAPGAPLFKVRGYNAGGEYIALAFFPNEPVERREVLIDPSYFADDLGFDRAGVLRHELGHVLGFRHEHIRSEAPALCPDEPLGNTINLTDYDPQSVMHYFCGDVGTRELMLTEKDRVAARGLYGPPDGEVLYYS